MKQIRAEDIGAQFPPDATEVELILQPGTVHGKPWPPILAALSRPHNIRSLKFTPRPTSTREEFSIGCIMPQMVFAMIAALPIQKLVFQGLYIHGNVSSNSIDVPERSVLFNRCTFSKEIFNWFLNNLCATQLCFDGCALRENTATRPTHHTIWSGTRKLSVVHSMTALTDALVGVLGESRVVDFQINSIDIDVNPREVLAAFTGSPALERLKVSFFHYRYPQDYDHSRTNAFARIAQSCPNLKSLVLESSDFPITDADAHALATIPHLRVLHLVRIQKVSSAALRVLLAPQFRAWSLADIQIPLDELDPPALAMLTNFIKQNPYLSRLVVFGNVGGAARKQLLEAGRDSALTYISIGYDSFARDAQPLNAALRTIVPMQAMATRVVRAFITGPQQLEVCTVSAKEVMYDADKAIDRVLSATARGDGSNISLHDVDDSWWAAEPRDARHFAVVRDALKGPRKSGAMQSSTPVEIAVVPYAVDGDAALRILYNPDRDIHVHAHGDMVVIRAPGAVSEAPLHAAWPAILRAASAFALPAGTLIGNIVELTLMRAPKPVLTREEAAQIARECDPATPVPRDAPTMYTFASGALAVHLPVLLRDIAALFANKLIVPQMTGRHYRNMGSRRIPTPAVAPFAVVADVFYRAAGVGADVVPATEAVEFMQMFGLVLAVGASGLFVYRDHVNAPAVFYRALCLLMARRSEPVIAPDGSSIHFGSALGIAVARAAGGGKVRVEMLSGGDASVLEAELNDLLLK